MLARYKGINEVLSAFENKAKAPYFSLWCKNMCIAQYNGDDIDEAREILTHEIEQNVKSGFNEVCTLKLHSDKEKKYTTKSDCYSNICFLSSDKQMPTEYGSNAGMQMYYMNEINNLKAEIEALKMQKIEDEEDEENEDNEDMGMVGQVNQLLTHPVVAGLIDKWLSGTAPVKNLAGLPNDVEECVNTLFKKGVTLSHLQKLANMPETKIKMLLTML